MTLNLKIPSLPSLPTSVQLSVDELLAWWGESVARKGVQNVPRWVWVGGSVLGAVLCFRFYYQSTYGVWKIQGVPGPKPYPVVGNMLAWMTCKDFFDLEVEEHKEFGSKGYYGIFYGSKPSLVVTDPDIIVEVMIKKFDLFPNRTEVKGFEPKYFRKNISDLRGEEWKKVRNALTPTFTGLKLKKMVPFMNEIGIHLGGKFERILETSAQEFELKPMFRSCTMDIILNIVFGISVDSQAGENEIANACMNMTLKNEQLFKNPLRILPFVVPGLAKLWGIFEPNLGFNVDAGDVTAKIMLDILQKKQEGKDDAERTFFLHTLVEKFELHQATKGKEGLDFETTVAQALIFLLAGFDTTANLLMWVSYYLALYPELQEEVYTEICSLAGPDAEDATYENVNKMQLLENFVMETLRLRSVFRTQREAISDTTIGPGIKIKKGYAVEVAVNVIHRDPKIWGDPETFRPSRFNPEEAKTRSPYAFNAFGIGPRNCIGMRLALFEVKMAFVKILSRFQLSMGKDTPTEVTEFMKSGFYDPVKPLFLKVSKRE